MSKLNNPQKPHQKAFKIQFNILNYSAFRNLSQNHKYVRKPGYHPNPLNIGWCFY